MANNKRVGIIDLGSNTFHLLICDITVDCQIEVFRDRVFVGLAEGGIEIIKPSAIEKTKLTLIQFQEKVKDYNVSELKIIGTAALRSASNAHIIQDICIPLFGRGIEIIDGDREADLIYKGVSQVADCTQGNHLIMDIGGGSTEFILVRSGKRAWSRSFNIGVAVMHEEFHKTEPISEGHKDALMNFLDEQLSPLHVALKGIDINSLIGASGSFEVVASMHGKPIHQDKTTTLEISDFEKIESLVIESDYPNRAMLKGMPSSRVKLIVVAFLQIRYILSLINANSIVISPYALKEGILSEMFSSKT